MNETIKSKLLEFLKSNAEETMKADIEMSEKVDEMSNIFDLIKIIQNYDELEPIIAKFFEEKQKKEKWER